MLGEVPDFQPKSAFDQMLAGIELSPEPIPEDPRPWFIPPSSTSPQIDLEFASTGEQSSFSLLDGVSPYAPDVIEECVVFEESAA